MDRVKYIDGSLLIPTPHRISLPEETPVSPADLAIRLPAIPSL